MDKPTEDEEANDDETSAAGPRKKKGTSDGLAANVAKPGKARKPAIAAKPASAAEDPFWDESEGEEDSDDDLISRLSEYSFSARCAAVTNDDMYCYDDALPPCAVTPTTMLDYLKCTVTRTRTRTWDSGKKASMRPVVIKACTATKDRRVTFQREGTPDTVEVILDSGSNGHILPVSVMTEVKKARRAHVSRE